jgi:hypothetical protein
MSADLAQATQATESTEPTEATTMLAQSGDPTPALDAVPPTEAQGEEQTSPKSDDAKPDSVPEKYEFTFPEGVELDKQVFEAFEPIARELKLTNEGAQKLADFYLSTRKSEVEAHAAAWSDQLKQWEVQVKADKEMGGSKFESSIAAARSVVKKFGSPELYEAFDTMGFGNHPELVRIFARIGAVIKDDSIVTGAPAKTASAEQTLYPTMHN